MTPLTTETSATYTYDDLNRKTGESIDYYGQFTKNLSYSYPNNWEQTFTGPDNVTLTHKYDAAGRLNTITIPGQGDIAYNTYEWNSPTDITLPGGSSTDYTYDALWQVNAITAVDSGSTDIMTRNYVYTNEGNITTKDTEHGTYTYTYDELYRLTDAVNPTVTDETYTYDNLGNRLTSAAVTGNWAYNLNNELGSYGGTTLTYDNNGNITHKAVGTVDTNISRWRGQTLLCGTTEVNGQFLGQDFNLLDMLPITAYDLTPYTIIYLYRNWHRSCPFRLCPLCSRMTVFF